MAFENVFGNVDFGTPVRAAERKQANFLDAIGRGMAMAQQKEQMDLRRRQVDLQEAEAAKPDPFKLDQVATTAAMKLQLGQEITPQEQAALSVKAQVTGPKVYTDDFGNQVVQPSGWASMAGMTGGLPAGTGGLNEAQQGQMANAIARQRDVTQVAPRLTENMITPMTQSGVEEIIATSPVAKTPFGQKELFKEEAKDVFEQRKAERAKRAETPAKERKIIESAYGFKKTADAIDDTIKMVTPFSAGVGSLLSNVPATPAKNLQAKLSTVKADAAFGALQAMRDASKTGGALGQVSERELGLLESAQAPLDQAQSPEQLVDSLKTYKKIRMDSLARVADAFEEDYGYRPKQIDNLIKSSMTEQPKTGVDDLLNKYAPVE